MQRRRGYMQFLILVLLLILEGAAIPKLQNDASYFSLGKSVVSEEFFRSHELTEEMVFQRTGTGGRTVSSGTELPLGYFFSFTDKAEFSEDRKTVAGQPVLFRLYGSLRKDLGGCPVFSGYVLERGAGSYRHLRRFLDV